MLQIRLVSPQFDSGVAFTDPIVLERADTITYTKTVNSSDETISFDLPQNDPKMQYVNYLRWWECWDTETNLRLNYGPITGISRTSGQTKKVSGPGRSAVLSEFYKSVQTFYYPIDIFLDDLRYENLAGEPRTQTIIKQETDSAYYGLSKRTKDYVIDEQDGYITPGRDTPFQGTIKSDVFWSGTGQSDYVTIDLGDTYTVSKARVLLPWWGGATINNNRAYDWQFLHSSDNSTFTQDFGITPPNHHIMDPAQHGTTLYFGESGYEFDQYTVSGGAIPAKYWKLHISDTHAWYGNIFLGTQSDEWNWECNQTNVLLGETVESPTISGGIIPTDILAPASDCHAAAVEIGVFRKIINRDTIPNLAYHQIQNDNRQITFYHVPDATEMIAASGKVKFEPGSFFRKVEFTSGGSNTVTDEWNTVLYQGGGTILDCPAYTRFLLFSDASTQLVYADTWPSKLDAFSYGGSYAYTTIQNDYAVLHFRGISVKWYATIPEGSTAARVSIQLRSKDNDGVWSSWTTLESSFTLPTGIAGEKVWEITPESNTLADNTIYELKITNLDAGGYCAIDAFAGYWSASFSEINQDDSRFRVRVPNEALTAYDGKFSFGSIYEFTGGGLTKQGLSFTGDRVIVYARKGPAYGPIKIGLFKIPSMEIVTIPGGEADKSLVVDLDNPYEIPQAVIFDSNDYFTEPSNALPWDNYRVGIYKPSDTGPIWVDGVGIHETSGLSVKFIETSHLDILKNTTEALQLEWDITENGVKIAPRIGIDTDVIFAEGLGTTIEIADSEDVGGIATMLVSNGADIDGLPLTTVVENKATRRLFGRTIQRLQDFRNVGSYFNLIGLARVELLKRRVPERKVTVKTINLQGISYGDSFIVQSPDINNQRMRAISLTRTQSASGGTEYSLECEIWPQIT